MEQRKRLTKLHISSSPVNHESRQSQALTDPVAGEARELAGVKRLEHARLSAKPKGMCVMHKAGGLAASSSNGSITHCLARTPTERGSKGSWTLNLWSIWFWKLRSAFPPLSPAISKLCSKPSGVCGKSHPKWPFFKRRTLTCGELIPWGHDSS